MKIHPLVEGTFTIDNTKIFVPFDARFDVLEQRPTGSLLVEVQPFLIEKGNDLILLDTGLGFHLPNGKLQIHANLERLGYSPNEVTKVIVSHLHKDHSGGISYHHPQKQRQLSFPEATYYIYKKEFEYALQNPSASYLIDEFDFLSTHGNTVFYEEENGELAPGIFHQWSGGHCQFHQVIKLQEGTETIFFAGDEASQQKQLKIRYIAKYDFDGKKAADLRAQYAKEGIAGDYTFLFYHDVALPFSKL